jgi:hypothetical protein
MKKGVLVLAFLCAAAFAGCGVGDAGRWIVDTSLRSAYGCSLLVSSDQSAMTQGDVARRPEPLSVSDPSVVLASAAATPQRVVRTEERERIAASEIEIAALPVSRDLSSIRGAGTLHHRVAVRVADARRSGRVFVFASRPLPPPPPVGHPEGCPGKKG